MTIVVGTDGSAGAANAMRWAARLASLRDARLIVMTGFEPTESELPPQRVDALLADQQAKLDSWADAARLGLLEVMTVVERGDPRPGILRVAERENAALIVVGRVGNSAGPGLLHTGSMAEWLAHHATLPLAVVGGAVNLRTRSVLIGVDGSDGSHAAVRWVRDLAANGELRVVAAAVDQPYLEWTPADSPKNWRRALERRIENDLVSELKDAGVEVEAKALRGSNVADALLQAAKDERTDIIAIGARGLGGFSGLRIGGVALKTLHRADRPVVLIPPTEPDS